MADLQQTFQSVLAEISKREQEVVAKEASLVAKESQLEQLKDELDELKVEVSAEQARLKATLDVEKAVEEVKGKELTLEEQVRVLGQKRTELVVRENKLSEIQAFQKDKEAEIAKREQDVSVREKTYKEQLQKEFIEELQKRFPH